MAVFHPHTVQCSCGNALTVELADSINVRRAPALREAILNGKLHRASCSRCGREMTVEKPFYYTDLARNTLLKVHPRGERHTWKQASAALDVASELIPDAISAKKSRRLRVCFGMDELREKLVAEDAGLDDRRVEMLKVLVLYEHPVLMRRPRLRLTLNAVTDRDLEFDAFYEHDPRAFRVRMPRGVSETLSGEALADWSRTHTQPLFDLVDDHWVNLWRWSPQPSALDRLRSYAQKLADGGSLDPKSSSFKGMLKSLPRGSHLPGWAKEDLRVLFEYAKRKKLGALQDDLFEIRFGIELEDDWSQKENVASVDTLWQLLKNLPDSDVEGNTALHEIILDAGGGGFYVPTSHDIRIGSSELANRERFEDIVRHEVGHSVHEMHGPLIDAWLKERFGWRSYGNSDSEIDGWIGKMGGWGDLKSSQKSAIRAALRTALGAGGSWMPGPAPAFAAGHPWYGAKFGPRLAFEKTGGYWFQQFKTWHRHGGKAFFLNYWYKTFIVVNVDALDLVAKMPDSYAAMSHFEFFAELFALYYDLDDEKRDVVPNNVKTWFKQNIGHPLETPAPSRPDTASKPPAKSAKQIAKRARKPAASRGRARAKVS